MSLGTNGDANDLEFDLWEGQFAFQGTHIDYPECDLCYWCHDNFSKVQMLEKQVTVLAENQTGTDDRYNRVKQENAVLNERVHMLEEQLREVELRAEERLQDEQRRNRDVMARVEREKHLVLENITIKLQSAEKEARLAIEELARLKGQCERLRLDKMAAEERCEETDFNLRGISEELRKVQELAKREKEEMGRDRAVHVQLLEEVSREVEVLRKTQQQRREEAGRTRSVSLSAELEAEVRELREENRTLREATEDLHAQLLTANLEEGRHLLSTAGPHNSLAAEFEAMSSEDLRKSVKDQQEVNAHLHAYIDGIILKIVENYPQLLEVKQKN